MRTLYPFLRLHHFSVVTAAWDVKFLSCTDHQTAFTSMQAAIADVDLVIHAAGPFQALQNYNVLEAALSAKKAYIDVADDTTFAEG